MSDFPRASGVSPATIDTFSTWCVGLDQAAFAGAITAPASAAWPAANRAIYVPFSLPFPYLLRKFFWCNGGTANGNVDCGIYSRAGTKICATGSTAQAGTSVVQSAAPSIGATLLMPDSYYLALALSSGTGTIFQVAPAANEAGIAFQATAFALPATFTLGTTGGALPMFGIADVGVI